MKRGGVSPLLVVALLLAAHARGSAASREHHGADRIGGAPAARAAPAGALEGPEGDDPLTRAALLALGEALALGARPPPLRPGLPSSQQQLWGAAGASYCAWRGVSCCAAAAALLPAPCGAPREVVALNLTAAGLDGTLTASLGAPLEATLQLLELAHNPGLGGAWPAGLLLPRVALLDVRVRRPREGWHPFFWQP